MSEEKKEIEFELKGDGKNKGQVEAVFSVFNDIDSDGDVVLPHAIKSGFKSGDVPMVWSHKWDMPIGKGSIKQDKSKATFVGEFFMDTESGKEAYNLVKNMGDLQQWSFGFQVNDSEYGKHKKDGSEDEQDVRYLKDLSVYEVSPVLVGANQDTFTMAIKSDKKTEAKIVESITLSHGADDGVDEEKGVLGHDSFEKEEPQGEVEVDPAGELLGDIAEDMKKVLKNMPEGSQLNLASLDQLRKVAKGMKEVIDLMIDPDKKSDDQQKVSEEGASVQGKRFSDEVKDVLAALNNLVARVQSIGELRKKNGRKLGASATDALRAVQESVQDAFSELDKFVDEFGSEGTLETETQVVDEVEVQEVEAEVEAEETSEVEVEAEVADNPVEETQGSTVEATDEETEVEEVEEAEAEAEVPVEETSEVTEVEVDDELDSLWLESQQTLTETILTDIEIEE